MKPFSTNTFKLLSVLFLMAVAIFTASVVVSAQSANKAEKNVKAPVSHNGVKTELDTDNRGSQTNVASDINIDGILSRDWMTLFDDGKFHAERPVSRSQMAVVVTKVFEVAKRKPVHPEVVAFDDVAPSHPHYKAIQLMIKNDLMTGYRKKQFYPDHNVDRAEGFSIIAQAYGVFQFNTQQVDDILADYSDINQAPAWSRKALATAFDSGFVNVDTSDEGSVLFKPSAMMTRGDLAYALTQYLKRIEDPKKRK